MIWNEEAKQIIGQSAKEVRDSEKGKELKSLPKAIESLLENKFLFKLAVSTENVSSIDYLYPVAKICDDEALIGIYSAATSMEIGGLNQSVSNLLPNTECNEADSQASLHGGVVSLSKDSNSQGTLEDASVSPTKAVAEDIVPDAGVSDLVSPVNLGSSTKPIRRGAGKRKFD